jgi:flagellar motor switch protein FliG
MVSPAPSTSVRFEELIPLSDDDWTALIRATDPNIVFLSLSGADQALVDRLLKRLPAREAQELRLRMEKIGPVRLADIDYAQRQLAGRAEQLAAEGTITIPSSKTFAAAA